ncbi:hypothetical protein CDAR_545401 [Caerostris darwini]|uniref:Uncharacterized protein n=1 Tax=Caerostris darwini TaxID=1538125 RepID=A0AAV4MB95_9ARAC|nr:hypothetical protein CDAR_545401 [Caerostris darwini]
MGNTQDKSEILRINIWSSKRTFEIHAFYIPPDIRGSNRENIFVWQRHLLNVWAAQQLHVAEDKSQIDTSIQVVYIDAATCPVPQNAWPVHRSWSQLR